MQVEQLGALRARIVGGDDGRGGGKGPLIVLLHGYGAPGDDLVVLARFLQVARGARFLFPEAPLSTPMGGRAWWPLDLDKLERRARGERIDRSSEDPAGLDGARDALDGFLEAAADRFGVPRTDMVLGGFSQGSMLACDLTLHARDKARALILLSSTLIAKARWEPLMASCRGLPVLQTHGTLDPLLPFEDAVALRDLFTSNGAALEFVSFAGGHEIPPEVLAQMARFITAQLG